MKVEESWIAKFLNIKKIKIALNSYIIDIILPYIFQIYLFFKYESKILLSSIWKILKKKCLQLCIRNISKYKDNKKIERFSQVGNVGS